MWRRIIACALICAGVALTQIEAQPVAALPLAAGLFVVATETSRRTTVFAVLATWLAVAASTTVLHPEWWTTEQTPWPTMAWAVAGAAFGDAIRSRREALTAVEERASEAARRQLVEERLGIARDVHDTVGHHMAVVNVQAGVAAQLVRDQPDAALEALGHVRRSARTVLTELGGLVSVLRDTEPDTSGLAALDELLTSQAAAGLHVESTVTGAAVQLPQAVDRVAYRVIQEALANARKYGTGRAVFRLTYGDERLNIHVHNEIGDQPAGAGNGLLGIRERIATVGGTVRAEPDGGGTFLVDVCLPIRLDASPQGQP